MIKERWERKRQAHEKAKAGARASRSTTRPARSVHGRLWTANARKISTSRKASGERVEPA